MLLRYDGTQAKFSRHGQTWRPGDIIDVEISAQDAAWMLRHGFTQLFPAVQAKVEEAPKQETSVNVVIEGHGYLSESAIQDLENKLRHRGRGGRK